MSILNGKKEKKFNNRKILLWQSEINICLLICGIKIKSQQSSNLIFNKREEIVASKIDKYNNNTPPPSPSVKSGNHLWRDMMGVLRRKDSTTSNAAALANALNNNRISCPAPGTTAHRSPSMSISHRQRIYYHEVNITFNSIFNLLTSTLVYWEQMLCNEKPSVIRLKNILFHNFYNPFDSIQK